MSIEPHPYETLDPADLPWQDTRPAHWGVRRIKSLFTERSRTGFPQEPLLAATQTMGVVRKDRYATRTVTAEKGLHLLKLTKPGDFVISLRSFQGGIELCHDQGIISPAYTVLEPNDPNIQDFISILFKSRPFVTGLTLFITGIRDGQNVNYSALSRSYLAIPPFEEQFAIVKYLRHTERSIKAAVHAKQRLVSLLIEQRHATVQRIALGSFGQNAQSSRVYVSPEGLPTSWTAPPLKMLATIQSGITLGKDYSDQKVREHPYLRVANVQAGRLDLSSVSTVRVPANEVVRSSLRKGDVLMTEGGDPDKLGRGCVWNGEIEGCLHQNHVFAVRPNSNLNPYFLAAVLGTQYAQTYFLITGKQTTNLASTSKAKIGAFRVPLPSLEDQRRILREITDKTNPIDAAITRSEREIFLLREYQTCLTADVVTGKLDVRAAAAALPDMDPHDPDLAATYDVDEAGLNTDLDGDDPTEESM